MTRFIDQLSLIKIRLSGVSIKNNLVKTSYLHKDLSFIYDKNEYVIRNVYEVFVKQTYKRLKVKNMKVIDIGASVGDSSIYFIMNGAKEVYAYETDSKRYEYMQKNLIKNNVGNIKTINSHFTDFDNINDEYVLKIDCEGCEYEFFNPSNFNKIKKLDQIIIEYHNGNGGLIKNLSTMGYNLSVEPINDRLGMIYAKRGTA